MRSGFARSLRFCACAFAYSAQAHAQTPVEGLSVGDRSRPQYDPLGVSFGAFKLYPAVDVRLNATDNYRATNVNRQSDVYATVQPTVRLASTWTRHRLNASAYYGRGIHFKLGDEDSSQYGASASGTYDISRRHAIRGDISAARIVESRSSLGSFRNSAEPVRYDEVRSGITITQSYDPLTLNWMVSGQRVDFHDVVDDGGLVFDQDFRDVSIATFGGSAQYDFRNGIGLLVSGQYNRSRYDFGPGSAGFNALTDIDRDASGYRIQAGVNLELTTLILGYFQLGYIAQRYRDPRLRDLSSLSFDGDILWNVTTLTSLRFRARRFVEETSSRVIAGNTRSDFSIRADHELYRNVVLNGDVAYGRFRPNGIGVGGQEYSIGGGARYFANRRLSFSANIRHSWRQSADAFLRYNATVGGIGLRFGF